MMRKKFRQPKAVQRSNTPRKWRFWLAVAIGSLLATTIVLFVLAHFAWGEQRSQMTLRYDQAKKSIANQLQKDDISTRDLEGLAVMTKAASYKLCDQNPLSSFYQQVVSSAGEEHQRCQDKAVKLASTAESISAVAIYMTADSTLGTAIESAMTETSQLKPNQYDKLRQRWSKAHADIKDTQVPQKLQSTKQASLEAVADIVTSYKQLESADKAQKRPDFDNAATDLQQAYAQLRDTKKQAEAASAELIEAFVGSVDAW